MCHVLICVRKLRARSKFDEYFYIYEYECNHLREQEKTAVHSPPRPTIVVVCILLCIKYNINIDSVVRIF